MVRSPAFRRFFAGIPAKAGTPNIGHFFPRAYNSHGSTPIIGHVVPRLTCLSVMIPIANNNLKVLWHPQREAAAWIHGIVASFEARCPAARELADKLRRETGTHCWIGWIGLRCREPMRSNPR